VSQTEHPDEERNGPETLPPNAENSERSNAPKQEKIAWHKIENAKQFWRQRVARPIAWTVRWIDKHDGVAIADCPCVPRQPAAIFVIRRES